MGKRGHSPQREKRGKEELRLGRAEKGWEERERWSGPATGGRQREEEMGRKWPKEREVYLFYLFFFKKI